MCEVVLVSRTWRSAQQTSRQGFVQAVEQTRLFEAGEQAKQVEAEGARKCARVMKQRARWLGESRQSTSDDLPHALRHAELAQATVGRPVPVALDQHALFDEVVPQLARVKRADLRLLKDLLNDCLRHGLAREAAEEGARFVEAQASE